MLTRTMSTRWPLLASLLLCGCPGELPIGRVDATGGAAGMGSGHAGQGTGGSGAGGTGEGRAGSDGTAGADAGSGGGEVTLCDGKLPSGLVRLYSDDATGTVRNVESLAVLQREVRESRAKWRELLASAKSYSFETMSSSWIGTTCTTRIDVEAGVVVGRKQTQTFSSHSEDGSEPPALESWFERGDEVGSHESACQAPVTLDELYDRCQGETLCMDPSENTFYLGYDALGVLTHCGYVPDNCADDCFRGFSLDWVRVGEGAVARPDTCEPPDHNPIQVEFVESEPVAEYETRDYDAEGILTALDTPGDYEFWPCCDGPCAPGWPVSIKIPPEWVPTLPECVRVQASLECGFECGVLTSLTLSDAASSEPLLRYGVFTDIDVFPGLSTTWHQTSLPASCEPSPCGDDWAPMFAVELEANGSRMILNDKESGVLDNIDVFLADGYQACVVDGPLPLAWIARVLD